MFKNGLGLLQDVNHCLQFASAMLQNFEGKTFYLSGESKPFINSLKGMLRVVAILARSAAEILV